MSTQQEFMQQCLDLAREGFPSVCPNPMVGAVLVHDEQVLAIGHHQYFGGPHAEVNCLSNVPDELRHLIPDATLFVSLEPCAHTGKTPPCTQLLLRSGIRNIFIASADYSDKVNGRGIQLLREAGVSVHVGTLEQEALELNRRFFSVTFHQRPYIILKWAQSAEGYLGIPEQRISLSSEAMNIETHRWRSSEPAIWVGYRTALLDNPQLNTRLVEGRHPIRIVYDRAGNLPAHLHLMQGPQETWIFGNMPASESGHLRRIQIPGEQFIQHILRQLTSRNIQSVLVEGGASLLHQLISLNFWDEARIISTPASLSHGIKAPDPPSECLMDTSYFGPDCCRTYRNPLTVGLPDGFKLIR